jgi:hypothetical protein
MRAQHIGRFTAAAGVLTLTLSAAIFGVGCDGEDDAAAAGCDDAARDVAAGSLQFNDTCCGDAECGNGTDTCADFSKKGQRCSKPCASDADCAGLGEGKCGGQGVCAVPG